MSLRNKRSRQVFCLCFILFSIELLITIPWTSKCHSSWLIPLEMSVVASRKDRLKEYVTGRQPDDSSTFCLEYEYSVLDQLIGIS
ncbi:hypothetical protein VTN96DRAFT_7426 [Rasamsonia emersonii]